MAKVRASSGSTTICVLGARSGTSALSGTLGLLGCALPKNIMQGNWANPKGYFEPQGLADLHDKMLASAGSNWHDWREFPAAWFESEDALRYKTLIEQEFMENYQDSPIMVLKEPRICRILSLWNSIFDDLNVSSVFCFIDRHPIEVARSLQARDGSSLEQGLLYYIRNHLDAESTTREKPRVFITFDDLLADWRSVIKTIASTLDLPLTPSSDQCSQIDEFLDRNLRHNEPKQYTSSPSDVYKIALDVHQVFTSLSRDSAQHEAFERLDSLRSAFNAWQGK